LNTGRSRAVACQIFIEPDGTPFGPDEQLCEPPLTLDQRQVSQVVAVMLDQVEGEQHRFMAPAFDNPCTDAMPPQDAELNQSEPDCRVGREL
jgi:hypothetical protein